MDSPSPRTAQPAQEQEGRGPRSTGVLALLAILAANHRSTDIDTSLARTPAAAATAVPTAEPKGDAAPFAGGAENAGAAAPAPADNGAVPLAR